MNGRGEAVRQGIRGAQERYYRLVLIVGPPGAGKTAALSAVTPAGDSRPISLGSSLGARLLALSRRERALNCAALLGSLLDEAGTDPVLLDNLEILFDPALKQDVLRLLQGLSRNRTIVAAWPGEYAEGVLTHAEPDHPEYVRYPNPDVVLVNLQPAGSATP